MKKPFVGDWPITNKWGEHPELYKQFLVKHPDGSLKPLIAHNGLDWATPLNTPLLAPISGKIIEATMDEKGYGFYVKIENDKEGAVIAHMKEIKVQVGFEVKEGDLIGLADSTGNSTNNHVHLGYYTKPRDRSNGYGGFIDPLPFLTELSVKTYTEEEYTAAMADRQKFWQERDAALMQLTELQKKLDDLNANYTAISALGIITVDDLQKERKDYADKVDGLLREIVQVRDRSATLADQIAKMDKEESAALDDALAAIKERDILKDELSEVKKTVGASTQVDFRQFLEHLQTIIAIVGDYFAKQKKPAFSPGTLAPEISTKRNGDWFWEWIGFSIFFFIVLGGSIYYFSFR